MKHIAKEKCFFFSAVLSLAAIVVLYPNMVWSPGSLLFDDQGDALKNYYVYLYHILHDEQALHFSGMNYPYGEFLLYTDSQPLLSSILRFLGTDLHLSLAFMHLCILLSLAFIGPLFYMILRQSKVLPVPALIVALLAVFLNPQAIRIGGHFALAWSFFIPLAWILTKAFLQGPRIILLALLSTNLLCAYLIHPYLGVLASGISFVWALIETATSRQLKGFAAIAAAALIPLLFFQSLGWAFDHHENRTSWPYGFYEYQADLFGVLLPHHGPIGTAVIQNKLNLQWEGWAYAGLAVSILFIAQVFWFGFRLVQQRGKLRLSESDKLLILASLFLIIATALPFQGPLDRLYEWLPPLRQFRAIGRFSWIWWYAMMVLAGIVFSHYWNLKPNLRPLLVALALFSALEGYWQHSELAGKVGKPICFRQQETTSFYMGSAPSQAILPLPFFHMGSDNSTIDGREEMVKEVMVESLATGLPFIGADESRISWTEARESIRLFSRVPAEEKPILKLFDPRPFKVLAIPELMSNRDSLFYQAFVHQTDGGPVCYPDSLRQVTPDFIFASIDSVPVWPEFRSTRANSTLIFENFEDRESRYSFSGTGSFEGKKAEHKELLLIPPGKLTPGTVYELSFWVWSAGEDQVNEMMIVEEYDPESAWKVWKEVGSVNRSSDFYRDWTLGKLEFTVERDNSHVKIMSKGSKGNRNLAWIDQLMLREKGCDVYSRDNSGEIIDLNNLPLRSYSGQQ